MLPRLTLLASLLLLPAACAGPPVVAMWNPATGEFHDCKSAEVSALYQWHPATECAAQYQANGWRIYY
ncbi:MAG TPA: hypothetical protein VKU84_18045 [Stellaceae bacterium]|nr:hypothetical protein [Stellaceae bacterium]